MVADGHSYASHTVIDCFYVVHSALLALMLNEVKNVAFKRVVQTITYLPHFLSWVIVAGFTMSILSMDNGSLNIALESLNLIDEPI